MLIQMCVMLSCAMISYQDLKDRSVVWTLFPLLGLLLAYLHVVHLGFELFLGYAILNILLVSILILLLFLYTRTIAKKPFLNHSFGLGDLLFFYAFALGFPTTTFIILFSGSILFSTLVYLILKLKKPMETIPLAGLMGIFLIGAISFSLFPNTPSLYTF